MKKRTSSKLKENSPKEPFTLAQALNYVLTGRFRRIETAFTDIEGGRYEVTIYSCKAYVRADFKPGGNK